MLIIKILWKYLSTEIGIEISIELIDIMKSEFSSLTTIEAKRSSWVRGSVGGCVGMNEKKLFYIASNDVLSESLISSLVLNIMNQKSVLKLAYCIQHAQDVA